MSNGIGVFQLAGHVIAILAIVAVGAHVIALAWSYLTESWLSLVAYDIGMVSALIVLVSWWTSGPAMWSMSDDNPVGLGTVVGSAAVIFLSVLSLIFVLEHVHDRRF